MAGMRTWTEELLSQLTWHWDHQLRPRLDGLTDDEYLWEPVDGAWTVRRRRDAGEREVVGTGAGVIDFAFPPPDPAPVTTIAWRLAHLNVGIFGARNATYFDGPAVSYESYDYPLDAATALAHLDDGQTRWRAGVAALSTEQLQENCREDGFETDSMAALILHMHREIIHHGAELALLRDLYLRRP